MYEKHQQEGFTVEGQLPAFQQYQREGTHEGRGPGLWGPYMGTVGWLSMWVKRTSEPGLRLRLGPGQRNSLIEQV